MPSMVVIDQIRKRAGKLALSTAGALVVTYFAYGAVQGDRGILAYFALSQEISRAQTTYDELRDTRVALERRVKRLHPDSLDLDLLEERAREVLDYVRDNDFVVLLPQKTETPPQ